MYLQPCATWAWPAASSLSRWRRRIASWPLRLSTRWRDPFYRAVMPCQPGEHLYVQPVYQKNNLLTVLRIKMKIIWSWIRRSAQKTRIRSISRILKILFNLTKKFCKIVFINILTNWKNIYEKLKLVLCTIVFYLFNLLITIFLK